MLETQINLPLLIIGIIIIGTIIVAAGVSRRR